MKPLNERKTITFQDDKDFICHAVIDHMIVEGQEVFLVKVYDQDMAWRKFSTMSDTKAVETAHNHLRYLRTNNSLWSDKFKDVYVGPGLGRLKYTDGDP